MAVGLSTKDLTVDFEVPGGGSLPALGPITFAITPGHFVCLVGPSGSGKSTLVRVFAGLQRASHGSAWVGEIQVKKPLPQVGMMFQNANLMPWRTIRDNIALPLELQGIGEEKRYQAVETLLPTLGLQEFADALPAEVSGGMAQRAALGRVMIQKPEVLLLDEPFGALDALTREKVSFDLLHIWEKYQQTALMVTHDIQEAVLLSDRVLVLSQRPGKIIADIGINLPRPRPNEIVYDEHFISKTRLVREAIDRA
ncbi:MAG: ABC transporter ATP-binding protein [Aggregatilineales bacterium]